MPILKIFATISCKKLFKILLCLLLPFFFIPLALSPEKDLKCIYIIILVAGYWILEPVPLAVTGLLPVVLFPMLGVMKSSDVCLNYMKEINMVVFGSLLMALAVEECNLHERIALKALLMVGTDMKWLLLGFMLSTMFLSMWTTNIATTVMMLPIVDAVIKKLTFPSRMNIHIEKITSKPLSHGESSNDKNKEENTCNERSSSENRAINVTFHLCICYSANIGGTGTLPGAAVNWLFKEMIEKLYPESSEITFATWMIYNIPGMLLCILISWIYLYFIYLRKLNKKSTTNYEIRDFFKEKYCQLGPITYCEIQVIILFSTLILLWFFRNPKFMPGWIELIGIKSYIGSSVPSIAISFLLFLLPSNIKDIKSRPILQWKTIQRKIPWDVIFILGGGLAIADGVKVSGLSKKIVEAMLIFRVIPYPLTAVAACLMTAMVTEIISNLVAAIILLPLLNEMSVAIGVNPLLITLPAAVGCSFAFMLPIATIPNTLAYSSANMKISEMAKPGLFMNFMCCTVQIFMINTLGVLMFDLHNFPSWATYRKSDLQDSGIKNITFPNTTLIN